MKLSKRLTRLAEKIIQQTTEESETIELRDTHRSNKIEGSKRASWRLLIRLDGLKLPARYSP